MRGGRGKRTVRGAHGGSSASSRRGGGGSRGVRGVGSRSSNWRQDTNNLKEREHLSKSEQTAREEETFQGKCREFCPWDEKVERKEVGDVSDFEREFLVKKFSRSAAGNRSLKAENVRDKETLARTSMYLFNDLLLGQELDRLESLESILDRRKHLDRLYSFLSDRFRAIRQDYTIQHIKDCPDYVASLEKQVALHVFAFCCLVGHLPEERQLSFDSKLCFEQIKQCIGVLMDQYQAGVYSERREELYACFLMLHIGSRDVGFILAELWENQHAVSSAAVQLVVTMLGAQRRGSLRGLFQVARQAKARFPLLYMFSKCLMGWFCCMGLRTLNAAFSKREPMRVERMARLLDCDEDLIVAQVAGCCQMIDETDGRIWFKRESFVGDAVGPWQSADSLNLILSTDYLRVVLMW